MSKSNKLPVKKYLSTRLFWSGGIISFPILLMLLFSSFIFSFKTLIKERNNYYPAKDSVVTLTLSFVGDLMCHGPQYQSAKTGKDSFDFKPVYKFIKEYLSSSDFTFGNLETVTAGKEQKFSGYPMFNSPDEYLDALKFAGFDFLFTSNNHSLDRSETGILQTLEKLRALGINSTGTFSNQQDRDSIRIIFKDGFTIAVLSYSYGTNGNVIPKGKDYLVNLINDELIKKDIDSAKVKKPDLILCYFHFGAEYKRYPNQSQLDVVKKSIEYGADIIIASHPHVIQPVKFYNNPNSKLDSTFVAFSLGNFISNQRERYKDAGVILNLQLEKNITQEKLSYKDISFIPTWVFKGFAEGKNQYFILPVTSEVSDSTFSFLSINDRNKMAQAFNDTKQILHKDISEK
ncbi:MAG: CapA family protein [Ignavibacteriales bacterium]|nr:MAG: CapA family protein [Ignavibacteriales bacterium]